MMGLLLMASGCAKTSEKTSGASGMPVSEEQICKDWMSSFEWIDTDETELPRPAEYLLRDLDGNGIDEVLVRAENQNIQGLLAYDAKGELTFNDVTDDGYLELLVGKGWYIRRFDDHMNEYRTWTSYYYKVENGKFDFVGDSEDGFKGLDEEGNPIDFSNDNTGGRQPAEADSVQLVSELEGWQKFSPKTLAALDQIQEQVKKELEAKKASEPENANTEETEPTYKAAELTLEGGTKCRVDMKCIKPQSIAGWTTYYRKGGQESQIPFFGTKVYDKDLGYDVYLLHEYNNGKCCGHLQVVLDGDGNFKLGNWHLNDRKMEITSYKETSYNSAKEPNDLKTPGTNVQMTKQFLPCSTAEIEQLLNQIYPNENRPYEIMLFDLNDDKTFEAFVRTWNKDGNLDEVFLWMQDGKPRLWNGQLWISKMKVLRPYIVLKEIDEKGENYHTIWCWEDGELKEAILDEEEHDYIIDKSYEVGEYGEWIKME